MTLHEVNEAASVVVQAAGEDANVIFGSVIDPNMDGELQITVVATGFGHHEPRVRPLEKSRAAAPAAEGEHEELGHPKPWREPTVRPNRWGRGAERGGSLDIPTFLRKQMD